MIETIHVINLSPDSFIDPYANPELKKNIARWRQENVLSISAQSKQHGFSCRFWEGNTEEEVFRSGNISRAFKQIVRYAKEKNLPMVTIMEDDGVLTSPNSWKYYNDNLPEDFDLYLGGIYAGQLEENRIVNGWSGNTLLTVHKNFYDFFLSANEDPLGLGQGHLDRWLGNFCFEKKYFVVRPFVVKQINNSYSDNHRRVQNYDAYEEKWEYYQD
jgi:hypothetical protein